MGLPGNTRLIQALRSTSQALSIHAVRSSSRERWSTDPLEERTSALVDMIGSAPVDMTGLAPVDMTGLVAVDTAGLAPVDTTGLVAASRLELADRLAMTHRPVHADLLELAGSCPELGSAVGSEPVLVASAQQCPERFARDHSLRKGLVTTAGHHHAGRLAGTLGVLVPFAAVARRMVGSIEERHWMVELVR